MKAGRILGVLLIVVMFQWANAGDPPKPKGVVTGFYAIDKLHAPCCAVMLKHALTNVTGVVSADVFITNQIVRINYRPGKEVLQDINRAFRAEIVEAKRLKKAPKGKLK